MQKLNFFSAWDRVDLVDYNNSAEEHKVTKGTIIYDIGMDPNTFYVVRKGKLIMETIIEIDSYFRCPVNVQTWEIRKTTRTIRYKLQDLWKGSMFGHEEIMQSCNRRCRVRALTDCTLIYINSAEISNKWEEDYRAKLREKMRCLDLDYLMNKINRYYVEKTKRNMAVLDSSSLNAHDFSGSRSGFMQSNN